MKSLRIVASTINTRQHLMKRATSIVFMLQRRMFSENNASFAQANEQRLQFPWNDENNQMMISLSHTESFIDKIIRKGFFFLEVDHLNEKDFLAGALTAHRACSDSIFEYCQEVQQSIQQNPTSLVSLTSHPALEKGKKRLKSVFESSLGEYILEKVHQYYEANPSAEVFYKREGAIKNPLTQVEEWKRNDRLLTIQWAPLPSISVGNSRFTRYTFPSNYEKEDKQFIDWMKKLFPVEYKTYDQLISKNHDNKEVALEVRAMLVVVQITSRELFYIKDKSSGALLQGSTEGRLTTHTISLELSNLRGKIGDEEVNRQGSWSVRDIDMINTVNSLS